MAKNKFMDLDDLNPRKAVGKWLLKRGTQGFTTNGLLVLAVTAAGTGIAYWVVYFEQTTLAYAIAGCAAGVLTALLALVSLLRFNCRLLRAFLIVLLAACYLLVSLFYLLDWTL